MHLAKIINLKSKLFLFLVCGLLLSTKIDARKQAVNNFTQKETTKVRKFIYDVTDFLLYEMFSVTDASPETVQFVREMQKQMGMERMTIRVRSFSRGAMLRAGRENALAVSIPYANTVLISEEWFNTLSEIEKKAIVGHELAHLKNKHLYKTLALALFTDKSVSYVHDKLMEILEIDFLSSRLFEFIIKKTNKIPFVEKILLSLTYRLLTWIVVYPPQIVSAAIITAFRRQNEIEADRVSALTFNNAKGVRDLMKRYKDLNDPLSRFRISRFLYHISKPMRKFLRMHPSFSKRIKEMEELDPSIVD